MIQVGDTVTRLLSSAKIPMQLKVAAIDDKFIYCGSDPVEGADPADYPGWKFDKTFGYEVDEDLGWGMQKNGEILTGSILVMNASESDSEPR